MFDAWQSGEEAVADGAQADNVKMPRLPILTQGVHVPFSAQETGSIGVVYSVDDGAAVLEII